MSRYNLAIAAELARQSYRFRVDDTEQQQASAKAASPLIGKEAALLEVLQLAEETHNEWLTLGPARRQEQKLMASFPRDCERLGKHLKKAIACWADMQKYGGQYELACIALRPETISESDDFIKRVERLLEEVLAGAVSGSQLKSYSYRGRPRTEAALEEFTKVLRHFWITEVAETFGYDEATLDHVDGHREPTSAAARFVMGAAKIIDNRYTIGQVREAMEVVNSDPTPF